MHQKLTKIFQNAKYDSRPELALNIWQTLVARDRHIARIKLWVFTSAGLASLVGLVTTAKTLLSELAQSGIYEYLSLIFGDTGTVIAYWKELVFSLAESLPIMSMIFTLSFLFIFFLSLKYILKQIYITQQLSLTF